MIYYYIQFFFSKSDSTVSAVEPFFIEIFVCFNICEQLFFGVKYIKKKKHIFIP